MLKARTRGAGAPAQAMVEASLAIAFLCFLLLALIDFGRLLNAYLVVVHATGEGARVAEVSATSTGTVVRSAVATAASDAMALGDTSITCHLISSANLHVTTSDAWYADDGSGDWTCTASPTNPMPAGTVYEITVTTQVQPIFPWMGAEFGSHTNHTIQVQRKAVGVVH